MQQLTGTSKPHLLVTSV
uniref:Uncharacterized protein n=1 Tax=Anguilla anguilla TaxID=7936 RepID=A0A0E9RHV0_ANGAN